MICFLSMQKEIQYLITKEDKYYVSQCLNVDVSSFGKTIDEAINNLKEVLDLYYEDNTNNNIQYKKIDNAIIGNLVINA